MSLKRLGAHVPWAGLEEYLPLVLDLGLAPEIAIKGPDLDAIDPARLERAAALITAAGVRPTLHAPFFDLNPGALDPLIRTVTARRFTQALEFGDRVSAHLMVVHPGFDRWRYPGLDAAWTEQAVQFFLPLLEQAARSDCRLALENIYEATPDTLAALADTLDSPWFGHCFDVGHWHLFGTTPMPEWLTTIGRRLFHLHLHDNYGEADDHLPINDGRIDFDLLFARLTALGGRPSMTLEAHSTGHLHRSLQQIRRYLTDAV